MGWHELEACRPGSTLHDDGITGRRRRDSSQLMPALTGVPGGYASSCEFGAFGGRGLFYGDDLPGSRWAMGFDQMKVGHCEACAQPQVLHGAQ